MSYDISLNGADGKPVRVAPHTFGGTVECTDERVPVGSAEASCDVTYNYADVTTLFGWSFKDLHGRTGAGSGPVLADVMQRCGTKRHPDYWAPTPGNVGYAASVLLSWAQQHPDATWEVT